MTDGVARELEQAEARLASAEAYVLDRYGIKGEALDELYDAAIEVGRLRALAVAGSSLELRERHGRRIREVWVAWAKEQPSPKESWLVPWEALDEGQREVDMRMGTALWGDGFQLGYETGLQATAALTAREEVQG